MIVFTLYKDGKGAYMGFSCKGHAGYDVSGSDIVCSAVSVLIITIGNSLEAFTDLEFTQEQDSGLAAMMFTSKADDRVTLLMDTLLLGMETIRINHSEYVDIIYKEVT